MIRPRPNGWRRVWAVPVAVGLATTAGLLTALVAEGPPAKAAACLALAAPLAALAARRRLARWLAGP